MTIVTKDAGTPDTPETNLPPPQYSVPLPPRGSMDTGERPVTVYENNSDETLPDSISVGELAERSRKSEGGGQ
jgi:hypothetical protein